MSLNICLWSSLKRRLLYRRAVLCTGNSALFFIAFVPKKQDLNPSEWTRLDACGEKKAGKKRLFIVQTVTGVREGPGDGGSFLPAAGCSEAPACTHSPRLDCTAGTFICTCYNV